MAISVACRIPTTRGGMGRKSYPDKQETYQNPVDRRSRCLNGPTYRGLKITRPIYDIHNFLSFSELRNFSTKLKDIHWQISIRQGHKTKNRQRGEKGTSGTYLHHQEHLGSKGETVVTGISRSRSAHQCTQLSVVSERSPLNVLADEVFSFGVDFFAFTNAPSSHLPFASVWPVRTSGTRLRWLMNPGLQGPLTSCPMAGGRGKLFSQPNGAKCALGIFMRTLRISIYRALDRTKRPSHLSKMGRTILGELANLVRI